MSTARRHHRTGRIRRLPVLGWIALMLVISAALRLGTVAGMAQALGSDPPASAIAGDPGAPATPALLEAFRERESRIAARESLVAEREAALARASAEVEDRLAALEEAETSLAAMLALADSAATDDLLRLTAVYQNMRPQEAAALFETMDPAFSAGFLGLMAPEAAAAILGRLSPEVAYSISATLAGRNSAAPRQ